jgi:hypothetical protein
MANMSYCRFENTYRDLVDCDNNLNDEPESETEKKYRNKLVKLCKKIADDFSD